MLGGINPKQMQGMMKKMGISQQPINASRVIFETEEGDLVIENPDVTKITMSGQETYQVVGEAVLQEGAQYSEDDIKMVMDKTEVDRELVIEHLQKNEGDIAATIMDLKSL
jgi:nascent polypeptide-associated complex subunit alpha